MDFVSGYQNLKKSLQPFGPIFLAAIFLVASPNARLEAKKLPAPKDVPNRAELPIPMPQVTPPAISAAPPSTEPPGPLTIKVEPVPFKLEQGKGPPIWTYWVPVAGPFISGLLAMFGIWVTLNYGKENNEKSIDAAMQTSAASIWQKANESELKELVAKLDGFYGPFLQMSEANFRMIKEFKKRHPEKPRTLTALFDEAWLSSLQDGDLKIISEVCQNAAVLEKFIAENAGMVDRQILPYLAAASAHFRFLRLAHEKQLGSDPTIFDKYVYPRSLDGVLRLEVERLMRRSDALRANPGRSPGLIEPLVIGSNLVLDAPEADAVWQADLPG